MNQPKPAPAPLTAASAVPTDVAAHAAASAIPSFTDFARVLAYLRPEDLPRIESAYRFAIAAHEGQMRRSGEPYVTHPIAVATKVAEWRLDAQAVMAALLHDVLEDTGTLKSSLVEHFGEVVAELVDGLSKLDKIEFQSAQEAQAENFRKMLLAMSRDLRVILIKLADRLHNMQTLGAMRPEKRQRIAHETLEIYAPIAYRLGLNRLCRELEELSFSQTHPVRFRILSRSVKAARGNRAELLHKIHDAIRDRLQASGVACELLVREKTIYSIYRKMKDKHLSFSQVLDIFGVRVVVADAPACYLALGALHMLYKPIPGKFKDYIALPKDNGYQSLHTTLVGPFGMPIEVQLRTHDMDHVAQNGIAAHWAYKTPEDGKSDLALKTHLWLQSLLDLQKGSGDSREFLEHVKVDLFPQEVYVFTPKGKILALPRGATCVDFAYAVHTMVGDCCVAAKVNRNLVPLRTELNNGDQVDIITAADPSPNPAWLGFVKTARARSKIRHATRVRQHDEALRIGERLLDQALRRLGSAINLVSEGTLDKLANEAGVKSRDELLVDIGLGKRTPGPDARRLLILNQFEPVEKREPVAFSVSGNDLNAVQFGHCCRPIPGDHIIGVVNQGQGMVIHAAGCRTVKRIKPDSDRLIPAEWDVHGERSFEVSLRVEVRNARGVLAAVASAIANAGSNIQNVAMDERRAEVVTTLNFTIDVTDRKHLAKVIRHVRKVPEVVRAVREREAGA